MRWTYPQVATSCLRELRHSRFHLDCTFCFPSVDADESLPFPNITPIADRCTFTSVFVGFTVHFLNATAAVPGLGGGFQSGGKVRCQGPQ